MNKPRLLIFSLVLLCSPGLGGAWADDLAPTRVGRISIEEGNASLRPAGADWSEAAVNDPVAAGMSLRTPERTRVQLSIGPDRIALSGGTQIEIGRLEPGVAQIAVPKGRIGIHLARLERDGSFEIDLPRGAVWLLGPGDYDIIAGDEKSAPSVAVLSGRAHVVAAGIDETVTASAADRTIDTSVAWWRPSGDEQRGQQTLRYIPSEMTGYEALDQNGRWEQTDDYGAAWFPDRVAEDWAPYRYGHWRWLPPWGWTWIDDKEWGFATSHYGRWARIDDRWAWVPGPHGDDPVYAPALVAFLGTPGVGLSYPDGNGPAVAWFPLAPGEVYWPAYTADLDAIRRINAGIMTDMATIEAPPNGAPPASVVRGDYRNRRFATVVPRTVFASGRTVAPAVIDLPSRRLDNAPLLAGSPQIPPAATRTEQVVRAVRTLARILVPRAPTPVAQAAAVLRGGRQAARTTTAAIVSKTRAVVRAARERIGPAAPRAARSRVIHLAAAGHRRGIH
jgi:uncharacterized protein DUF6600